MALDSDEAKALKEFKGRGLAAADAYRCCRGAFLKQSQWLLQLVDFVEDASNHATQPREASLVGTLGPAIRAVSTGRAVAPVVRPLVFTVAIDTVGQVDVQSRTDLDGFPFAEPELQAIRKFVNFATNTTTKPNKDCIDCIRRKLWRQTKRRQRVGLKTKVGGESFMSIRIPHR